VAGIYIENPGRRQKPKIYSRQSNPGICPSQTQAGRHPGRQAGRAPRETQNKQAQASRMTHPPRMTLPLLQTGMK